MNLGLVEKIADAVLYEGYMLYPYRASAVKNRQRFNWGVVTPQTYSTAHHGTESWQMQTECLLVGNEETRLDVIVRFLHLCEREICQLDELSSEFRVVESLEVDGKIYQTWQEAVEREVKVTGINLSVPPALAGGFITPENPPANAGGTDKSRVKTFSFPSSQETEPLTNKNGENVGVIARKQKAIEGVVEVQSEQFKVNSSEGLYKITVRVLNLTACSNAERISRDEALAHSLVSTHTVLAAHGGEFVSQLEPPDELSKAVAECKSIGAFPVLVGENGERDVMLSSPIILYDYPQIAAESAGELFDGTEIDEILTLRIMTMTDEEKREMRSVDERARRILERTEQITPEELMNLHGAMRGK